MFSPATVALLAKGRAQVHVEGSETPPCASKAEYVCVEVFEDAVPVRPNAQTEPELTRADIKRVLRELSYFGLLSRKLGFGVEAD